MGRFDDVGPFTIVPEWLLNMNPSGEAIIAYCRLGIHANKDGACWPSVKTLAAEMGITERSVQRRINELESLGAVLVSPRKRPDGSLTSNAYFVVRADPHTPTKQEWLESVADDDGGMVTYDVTRDGDTGRHNKEPDPDRTRVSFPDGKLRLGARVNASNTEPFATVALQVWKQREQDNTLPFGRAISSLMQLSKEVVARIGEEKAYSLLLGLPDFTPGYANFAMNTAVKGKSTYEKNMEVIARGAERERARNEQY